MKKLVFSLIFYAPFMLHALEPSLQVSSRAATCGLCHGSKGLGTTPLYPNLAGQHEKYLLKQLHDIKRGELRSVPEMKALLSALSAGELEELAAYYAKMQSPQNMSTPSLLSTTKGEQIYRVGNFAKRIPACSACHGPRGNGNAEAGFPALSAQHASYIVKQLQQYKEGKRTNDLNHIMRDISIRMSQDDMEDVAQYIEYLH